MNTFFFFLPLVKKCQHKKQVQWGKELGKKKKKSYTLVDTYTRKPENPDSSTKTEQL